jgi:hypothetical protein
VLLIGSLYQKYFLKKKEGRKEGRKEREREGGKKGEKKEGQRKLNVFIFERKIFFVKI